MPENFFSMHVSVVQTTKSQVEVRPRTPKCNLFIPSSLAVNVNMRARGGSVWWKHTKLGKIRFCLLQKENLTNAKLKHSKSMYLKLRNEDILNTLKMVEANVQSFSFVHLPVTCSFQAAWTEYIYDHISLRLWICNSWFRNSKLVITHTHTTTVPRRLRHRHWNQLEDSVEKRYILPIRFWQQQ